MTKSSDRSKKEDKRNSDSNFSNNHHSLHNMNDSVSQQHEKNGACHTKKGFDYLLWGSLTAIVVLYFIHLQHMFFHFIDETSWLYTLSKSIYNLMNTIWWGIAIGILMVALLSKIPRQFIMSVLGSQGGLRGVLRATLGGVLLDLCSHGILLVGAKLYERGATAGQLMAFLVASPWNSFSFTLVLVALIGLPWTLGFIFLSLVIAVLTGLVFDLLVKVGKLPENPNRIEIPKDFKFWTEAKRGLKNTQYTPALFKDLALNGLIESRLVLRWILFGVLLAGLVETFIDTHTFETYFGPTIAGLGLTVLIATVLEICSEGSAPIAADLFNRAHSPGNSFAFLMTGVSTDYTEIMVLKDTTKSWKLALFLPLITLPQVILIGWLINLIV